MNRAAIDIGSNSVRLLIKGDVAVRELRTTRLGAGAEATGRLSAEAIRRTLDALAGYAELMERHQVAGVRVVATAAVREAANPEELIVPATDVLGCEVEVINGDTEAALTFAGVTSGLVTAKPVAIIDIGGGSTEVMVGRQRLDEAVSLPMGCVRWTERYFAGDDQADLADRAARDLLQQCPVIAHDAVAVGVAGTVTTVAALELGLTQFVPGAVHGHELSAEVVGHWFERLRASSLEEIEAIPGMPLDRASVVVGGLSILDSTMKGLQLGSITVSEADILEGIIQGV